VSQVEQQEAECRGERDSKIAPHIAACVRQSRVQCDQARAPIKKLSAPHDRLKQDVEELRGRVQAYGRDKGALHQVEGRHQQLARRVK